MDRHVILELSDDHPFHISSLCRVVWQVPELFNLEMAVLWLPDIFSSTVGAADSREDLSVATGVLLVHPAVALKVVELIASILAWPERSLIDLPSSLPDNPQIDKVNRIIDSGH